MRGGKDSSAREGRRVCSLAVCGQKHCLVVKWKDCEVLKPTRKEKCFFVDKKREGIEHCCCQQVPMHETWKGQQGHEDARKMYRTEIFGNLFGKMEKATSGRTRNGKKN